MTVDVRRWSLGARMVAMFCGLLAMIAAFMLVFFPGRMARQAQADAEQRGAAIAQVMSTALGPALEFDDPDNASSILRWLATTRDARFGMVRAADGKLVAVWQPDEIPSVQGLWPTELSIETTGDLLVVTTPIHAIGGGRGTLHLGFSLEHLATEHAENRNAVAIATLVVFAFGVLATLLLAAFVVRPIRRLATTALKISRGELPPELPAVSGDPEVARLAGALRLMLDRINQEAQQELVRASRHAGMAEVATGVLHNVGNVLTSVNVTLEVLREHTSAQPIERLRRLHALLDVNTTLDGERLATALRYMSVVADELEAGRATALHDLDVLGGHVDHIKRVVAMQNAYARLRSVVESTRVQTLLEEAAEIACPSHLQTPLTMTIDVVPELAANIAIDRHRVLQIVVNLISNARDAVMSSTGERTIAVRANRDGDRLEIRVIDSGVGISAQLLARIFSAGYTSKPQGHGYGLHSSALAAKQLGGTLAIASLGVGHGATFTLTVPIVEGEP